MAEPERDLVEILEDSSPIDIIRYINSVRNPSSGAIATFIGTTRDIFDDKPVLQLRYEAYVPMAIRQLKSICSSARSLWNLHSIAIAHRLGTVPVGEESVFVAVSSIHRIDALKACQFIIDEIKASVPIWKKEIYPNGEVWKENSEFFRRKLVISGDCRKGFDGDSENLEVPHRKLDILGDRREDLEVSIGKLGFQEGGESRGDHQRSGCCGRKVKVSEADLLNDGEVDQGKVRFAEE